MRYLIRISFFLALAIPLISAAAQAQESSSSVPDVGVTSFYTSRLNGHITASGERFNNNALTAAHRTLPLGTRVRLTNVRNHRSVIVRVNDRGPFVSGREISVTRRAAAQLGFLRAGTAKVQISVLSRGRQVRHRGRSRHH
ncbi:MAG: septal ring lytic transglycosylase RlpA family protein [Acidobacteriaceae bacterium]|nr:septal ring lytic transglycosylase RlpA family protein [Acidobacteriaceae bacterium]MBV9222886.1 septal ring lytic transglycosylase RlpA family protein [Acidobacteriaceae bacterium]MBV9306934.1 septal ring lytic transglycosylase RlpA family protein [Acidobacteriaceae bacterium]